MGIADWEGQAERGFRRAVQLDSTFAAAINHLVTLYARQGRTSEMRAVADAELAREAQGASADYLRLRSALALGRPLPRSERELDSLATETLAWIGMNTQDDGVGIEFGARAIAVRSTRPATREERLERTLSVYAVALNTGRPSDALVITERMHDLQPDSSFVPRLRVLSGLYGDGESAAARTAAAALLRRSTAEGSEGRLNRCVREMWMHERGDVSLGIPRRAVREQRAAGRDSILQVLCETALRAMQGGGRTAEDSAAIGRLDEMLRSGLLEFYPGDGHVEYAPIVLARLLERIGDRAGALAALRRRPYFIGWQPFHAASLLYEARLAAELGDRAGAVRAYEHYLAFRRAPEPGRSARRDSAAAEFALLR
jgi:hypothetical protein